MSISVSLSGKEQDALQEADPFLFKLYVYGIRRYMDYETGIVGIRRRISWESLAEECYVAPRSGVQKSQTGKPKRNKLRRAIETLQTLGLLSQIKHPHHLIFDCLLATSDKSVQKQVGQELGQELGQEVGPAIKQKQSIITGSSEVIALQVSPQVGRQVGQQVGPPPNTDITDIKAKSLCRFTEFWEHYPRKENKKKALDIWMKKNLNEKADLIINDVIVRKAHHWQWRQGFIPHATTYLNGDRWEDEIREASNENGPRSSSSGSKQSSIGRALNSYLRNRKEAMPQIT